ncbi:MAG TPA: diguanylate cyclase [Candidatus Methanoperedens sp.]|nr:diguanylate cyclase [Candidatus Methanoperedens sp.]
MKRAHVPAALALLALWTAFLALMVRRETALEEERLHAIALSQARALVDQVVDAREWNAAHGGVYVPVTAETPPNPYLELPDRDVTTLEGRRLTLVNPAYMTRQIAEITRRRRGIAIHLTSLAPLRPGNAPEAWEREALVAIERGAAEFAAFAVEPDGREVLRYLAPLRIEAPCLACHARQGYRLGQLRGGIAIASPAELLGHSRREFRASVLLAGSVLWVLGAALIGAVAVASLHRSRSAARLCELATVDDLTGLHNRRGFLLLAEKQLQIAQRTGRPDLLLFVDLDGMKDINDRLGHEAGDAALRRAAAVLRDAFRTSDIIGRYGGDEFLVLCPNTGAEAGPTLLEGLAQHVADASAGAAVPWRLSLSVGYAAFDPADPVTLDELFRKADAAMYAAKQEKSHRPA